MYVPSVCTPTKFKIGDEIEKVTGDYLFCGVIVSVFCKTNGKVRYVAQNADGILHIFSEANLKHLSERDSSD